MNKWYLQRRSSYLASKGIEEMVRFGDWDYEHGGVGDLGMIWQDGEPTLQCHTFEWPALAAYRTVLEDIETWMTVVGVDFTASQFIHFLEQRGFTRGPDRTPVQ
jgi:hypothetical protein